MDVNALTTFVEVDVFPDYQVTAALDETDVWLLYPSRKYVPQKVELFVAYLRKQFRDGPPWTSIRHSEGRQLR